MTIPIRPDGLLATHDEAVKRILAAAWSAVVVAPPGDGSCAELGPMHFAAEVELRGCLEELLRAYERDQQSHMEQELNRERDFFRRRDGFRRQRATLLQRQVLTTGKENIAPPAVEKEKDKLAVAAEAEERRRLAEHQLDLRDREHRERERQLLDRERALTAREQRAEELSRTIDERNMDLEVMEDRLREQTERHGDIEREQRRRAETLAEHDNFVSERERKIAERGQALEAQARLQAEELATAQREISLREADLAARAEQVAEELQTIAASRATAERFAEEQRTELARREDEMAEQRRQFEEEHRRVLAEFHQQREDLSEREERLAQRVASLAAEEQHMCAREAAVAGQCQDLERESAAAAAGMMRRREEEEQLSEEAQAMERKGAGLRELEQMLEAQRLELERASRELAQREEEAQRREGRLAEQAEMTEALRAREETLEERERRTLERERAVEAREQHAAELERAQRDLQRARHSSAGPEVETADAKFTEHIRATLDAQERALADRRRALDEAERRMDEERDRLAASALVAQASEEALERHHEECRGRLEAWERRLAEQGRAVKEREEAVVLLAARRAGEEGGRLWDLETREARLKTLERSLTEKQETQRSQALELENKEAEIFDRECYLRGLAERIKRLEDSKRGQQADAGEPAESSKRVKRLVCRKKVCGGAATTLGAPSEAPSLGAPSLYAHSGGPPSLCARLSLGALSDGEARPESPTFAGPGGDIVGSQEAAGSKRMRRVPGPSGGASAGDFYDHLGGGRSSGSDGGWPTGPSGVPVPPLLWGSVSEDPRGVVAMEGTADASRPAGVLPGAAEAPPARPPSGGRSPSGAASSLAGGALFALTSALRLPFGAGSGGR